MCYLCLVDPTAIDSRLRELQDSDVRGLSEHLLWDDKLQEENSTIASRVSGVPHAEHQAVLGEGRRTLSWLWYASGSNDKDDGMNEDLWLVLLSNIVYCCFS